MTNDTRGDNQHRHNNNSYLDNNRLEEKSNKMNKTEELKKEIEEMGEKPPTPKGIIDYELKKAELKGYQNALKEVEEIVSLEFERMKNFAVQKEAKGQPLEICECLSNLELNIVEELKQGDKK